MKILKALQPCEAARALQGNAKPQQASLSLKSFRRASDFILEFGTNLQRERLLYHFPSEDVASKENVLAALRHYQNKDGGFGHGLEPDLRTKRSTVIATTVGLQILDSIDALASDLADDAIQYLNAHYRNGTWQCIHEHANDAPHAPWWRYETPDPEAFAANPSVEVIRYFLDKSVMASDTEALVQTAVDYIAEQPLEMHELLCFVRLYESKRLSKTVRLALLPHLLSNGYRLVNIEPKDWEEYCLMPLTVVTGPESVFAEFFADTIESNIQFLVEHQLEDGGWQPNWSWAGEFPATWRTVETEIKAEITLKNLLQLKSFGRICGPSHSSDG